jgi:hypothetical protein
VVVNWCCRWIDCCVPVLLIWQGRDLALVDTCSIDKVVCVGHLVSELIGFEGLSHVDEVDKLMFITRVS